MTFEPTPKVKRRIAKEILIFMSCSVGLSLVLGLQMGGLGYYLGAGWGALGLYPGSWFVRGTIWAIRYLINGEKGDSK
jgi:hypothetical protein